MPKKLTQLQFIEKANLKHNFKYDYSLSIYNGIEEKVEIICPIHKSFKQTPHAHLAGQQCPDCGLLQRINTQTFTLTQFVEKASKIHNNKYDYSLAKYQTAHSKITIICPIHGEFIQIAYDHLNGHGCKKCGSHSVKTWSRKTWIDFCNSKSCNPLVYIIRCFNKDENFIKIGITSNSIKYRFKSKTLPYSYEVLKEIKGSPDFVWDKEIELHKLYKEYMYLPLLPFGGQTECFKIEILNFIS